MLKFSSEIFRQENVQAIGEFLNENELVCWTIEKDEFGKCLLCGYVEDEATGNAVFLKVKDNFTDLSDASVVAINPTNWVEEYKKFAKPWSCEDLHWVPLCMKEEVEVPEYAVGVSVDAEMAFGSGSHETTQLCARILLMFRNLHSKTDDLVIKDCIDAGCGSGILGISAVKLGLSKVTFIDTDADALRICKKNALQNGLFADQMDFAHGDIKICLLGRQTDLLMANILANVLVDNANLLVGSVKSGGLLCLSGILKSESQEVASVFSKLTKAKWESVFENSLSEGEWTALAYFRG
ncbi:MAG: 50S ribosomal protein L11 methyltransferase [Puniceicoccales bacterium]|jgi:ribosomal protein L11 methyltransferase|nr:50S ribosomal protein L11 methyltransferase [Puniceicoccales bacterium]